jgi:hypothetical protein
VRLLIAASVTAIMPQILYGDNSAGGYYSPPPIRANFMRRAFLLIVCLPCLSGCAGVWDHWVDGPGWLMGRTWNQAVQHAPGFAAHAAVDVAGSAADSALDDATAGHESKGERQQRKIDNLLDNN